MVRPTKGNTFFATGVDNMRAVEDLASGGFDVPASWPTPSVELIEVQRELSLHYLNINVAIFRTLLQAAEGAVQCCRHRVADKPGIASEGTDLNSHEVHVNA